MFWEGLGHEPLRVCFRKLLTPSPHGFQITCENKGATSNFQKLNSLAHTLTPISLSLLPAILPAPHYSRITRITLSHPLFFMRVIFLFTSGLFRNSSISIKAWSLYAKYMLLEYLPSTSVRYTIRSLASLFPTRFANLIKSSCISFFNRETGRSPSPIK